MPDYTSLPIQSCSSGIHSRMRYITLPNEGIAIDQLRSYDHRLIGVYNGYHLNRGVDACY